MQVFVDVYMEPMLLSRKPELLAGSNGNVLNLENINDKKLALHLIFDQQLPEQYLVWTDFLLRLLPNYF
ncbi:Uncharacterised protein [Cronobacter universalis NCTC 9529]|uniref:Uncharacterized protein n=1 Tax=Cronobacter universalis NCTC 9529 TaxID=1074000 RepID=A0ABY1VWT1_9ENTR|nr:hypothetical protein [Cronobacter universalis]STC96856.1 Uncharacterised protein [Cronobacter universalis NCTC 9529]